MINSTRLSLRIMHLAHLKLLLQIKEIQMGLKQTKEISITEGTIITTSMITTLMVDSSIKTLTISLNRKQVVPVSVQTPIKEFLHQVKAQVATITAMRVQVHPLITITTIII